MTPKEKAEELIERFFEVQIQDINALPRAKQCSLIAVYEIINNTWEECETYYWKEVKQEIERL